MDTRELYRLGRQRWPALELDESRFSEFCASNLTGDVDDERAGDLYLAYACASGEETALRELETNFMPAAVAAVRRMRGSQASAEEIAQVLRTHVLVADGTEVPRIATYAARGSLKRWLVAIAVRRYLNSLRGKKREVLIGDNQLLDAFAGGDVSPELALFKESYRDEFRTGFSEALDALDASKKTLLRHRYVDGLSVTDLAKLHAVHRATLHRWLSEAQEEVAEKTEAILCARLKVSADELASIRRLVRSQLEVSLERLLADG